MLKFFRGSRSNSSSAGARRKASKSKDRDDRPRSESELQRENSNVSTKSSVSTSAAEAPRRVASESTTGNNGDNGDMYRSVSGSAAETPDYMQRSRSNGARRQISQSTDAASDGSGLKAKKSVLNMIRPGKSKEREKHRARAGSVFQMSEAERAFLPREVQRRLGARVGQLPPAPSVFPGFGAVLFVDISGFTALGERLRERFPAERAAELLSNHVVQVLDSLSRICLQFNGDVAKFAGDALLCVWEGTEEDDAMDRARACSVEMLMWVRGYNRSAGSEALAIHGGVAKGSLLHFHLGSPDDDLRWYLVAGEAVAGATTMVDDASPGEIVVYDNTVVGKIRRDSIGESLDDDASGGGSFREGGITGGSFNSLTGGAGGDGGSAAGTVSGVAGTAGDIPPGSPHGSQHSVLSAGRGSNAGDPGAMSPLLRGGRSQRSNSIMASPNTSVLRKNYRSQRKLSQSSSGMLKKEGSKSGGGMMEITGAAIPESDAEDDTVTPLTNMEGLEITRLSPPMRLSQDASALSPRPASVSQSSRPQSPGGGGGGGFGGMDLFQFLMSTSRLTADSEAPHLDKRARVNTDEDPYLRGGLPRTGNVYIPRSLRQALRKGVPPREMRPHVSVIFVGLEELSISEDELLTRRILDDKLDLLNRAFVDMTRITHSFEGEVRDLLFDDKGCIFIAVFGAHKVVEMSELKAVKAALAISNEVENARIGVAVGTCFAGLCGTAKRHDFVVMGHEVNMSARYMGNADPGEVLVSPEIQARTLEFIEYEEIKVVLGKSVDSGKTRPAYRPNAEIARRPSFLAQYRYGQLDKDLFVGRQTELRTIERVLNETCFGIFLGKNGEVKNRSPSSGIILLEAVGGMGKSSLVSRARKMGKGRIKIVTGSASSLEQHTRFYAFEQVFEAFTGLREGLTKSEVNAIVFEHEQVIKKQIDREALNYLLPFLRNAKDSSAAPGTPPSRKVSRWRGRKIANSTVEEVSEITDADLGLDSGEADVGEAGGISPALMERITDTAMLLLRAGRKTNGASGAQGALVIVEDVHWLDIASLHLLLAIVSRLAELRSFVFMLTHRPVPKDSSDVAPGNDLKRRMLLIDLLARAEKAGHGRMDDHGGSTKIVLEGLTRGESDVLIARALGANEPKFVSPDVLSELHERTGGFPMYLAACVVRVVPTCTPSLVLVKPFGTWPFCV